MKADYETMAAQLDTDIALRNGAPVPLDGVILSCGADLMPEPVSWLWQYWLALGKMHILAGAPGQGKTTLALAMAATVTIGDAGRTGRAARSAIS